MGLSDALDGPAGRGRTVRNAIAHAIEHSDGPRFRMLLTQHLGQIRHSDQTFLISYFSVLAIDIANNGNYSLMREFIRGIEDLTLLVPHYVFGEIADALRRYRDAFFAEDSHDRRGFDGLIDLLKEKIGAIEEKKRREARLRFRRRYF